MSRPFRADPDRSTRYPNHGRITHAPGRVARIRGAHWACPARIRGQHGVRPWFAGAGWVLPELGVLRARDGRRGGVRDARRGGRRGAGGVARDGPGPNGVGGGDVTWTLAYAGEADPPYPSVADVLYLAF